jgi:hypothetical protein
MRAHTLPAVRAPDGFRPICVRHERSHVCRANDKRPAVRQPAERKVGSEREDRRPEESARRSALLGFNGRKGDPLRHAMHHDGGREGHQHSGAARVVVDMQAALSRITRTIVRRTVVMAITVMVVVVTIMMVAMVVMIVTMVNMVQIAIRVRVKESVRENAGRRPAGHTDDGCQRKHEQHRPDQGNAASARSFQSRQHPFRHLPFSRPTAAPRRHQ